VSLGSTCRCQHRQCKELVCSLHRRFGDKLLSSEKARELGLPGGKSQWLEADINCFAACLSRCGKDFGLIAQQLQPPKTRGEVVSFYYDMWKTRKIPRARQWYNAAKEVGPHSCISQQERALGHSLCACRVECECLL
jgi:hypothetical protein